jgi:2-polyprenyl-3-methyl-5-hydroxy-6-metoxy-1,4-benzoquinol methylase
MDDERQCIVCGRGAPFSLRYARHGFTIVSCDGCGLAFQDPQPTEEDLAKTYYHDEEWTRAILGPLREKVQQRARHQLDLLAEARVSPTGALLDVGCSIGEFMALAERAGWRATGVEIGAATAASARERGLDVRTGTLSDVAAELEPAGFSLVTFWDVLEHLRDPRHELELARRVLRPGGLLAAAMPNAAGWYPRATFTLIARPTGRWEFPELPVHLYDFSPDTLRRLLLNAGFQDVQVRTFATPFDYYRSTSLSIGALGGRWRGRALRAAFELIRLGVYPAARLADRQNAQFVTARLPA